jgi:hypothetical protein
VTTPLAISWSPVTGTFDHLEIDHPPRLDVDHANDMNGTVASMAPPPIDSDGRIRLYRSTMPVEIQFSLDKSLFS